MTEMENLILALTELVKKLGASENAPSGEQRMESLANSMQVFHYEPDEGHTFEAWYRRYEEIFQEDAKSLNDAERIRLVLRKLDANSHDRFKDMLLPKSPKDFPFAEVVKKLKDAFGRQESLFNTRYKCLQATKSGNTDFVTYAAQVNRQCEDFRLKELDDNQFKCLMFVRGLQSSQDAEIRTRLLAKLDGEDANEQSLEKLIAETQRILSLKRDTAIIGGNSKSQPVINAMKQTQPRFSTPSNQPKNKTKDTAPVKKQTTGPSRPCWLCGGIHFVRNCKFATHKCNQCYNVGHKDGYCQLNKPRVSTSNKPSNQLRTQVLRVNGIINGNNHGDITSRRKYINVEINGTSVKLQIDTASDLTIISEQTWQTLGSPGTTYSPMGIKSASKDSVPIIAEFDCEMGIKSIGQVYSGKCLVTNITELDVLGIDWIERFDIWDRPINKICNVIQATKSEHDVFITELKNESQIIFSETPGKCLKAKAIIHIKPDVRPIYRPKRPVSFAALEGVECELDRLQKLDIISPIEYSEWAAPIVAVKRPNGRIRICADYSTGLNSCIETNSYPLPSPEEMFAQLAGSKVFSKIDLSDAYLQIEVDDKSKRFLTINTHKGLFTFNRLPFGVKSAPGIFQQIMDAMLAGLDGTIAYFDDILVHSKDEETHKSILKRLFKRLEEYGFRVKLMKCNFFCNEINYLGMIINSQGITTDPSKISAITSMPAPQNVPQLRSFLGAINFYGKFVRQMHELRAPLDRLLNTNVKWEWSLECQQSFDKFKRILTSELLLTHYDQSIPVKIYADASNTGVGASIAHVYSDRTEKMISHASRTLTKAEKNYSQVEKEGLALVYAVKKFHRYIYGRRFTLVTDHKPLLSIFGSKNGIPVYTANRLQRWALTLATYDFDISYMSTKDFGTADILSRLIASNRTDDEDYVIACLHLEEEITDQIEEIIDVLPITRKIIETETQRDQNLRVIIQYLKSEWPNSKAEIPDDDELAQFYNRRGSLSFASGCVMFGDRLVIPQRYRKLMLRQLHKAHLGTEAMKILARAYVYWPKIDYDITELARSCSKCAENAKSPVKTLLQSWPRTIRPMERVHTDIAGPIEGKWYLVTVDSYSMFPDVQVCTNITSTTCIEKMSEFFSHNGNPETLVTDNGTQFVSKQFSDFCRTRGIKHILTPPYHPMSNGRAERFVDTLKRALNKAKGEGTNKEVLTKFLHAYRSTPNRNAQNTKSPAELFLGRPIRMELDLLKPTPEHGIDRDIQQEQQFNQHHGARYRSFSQGDKVYAKVYRHNEQFWECGVIEKRIGRVIYSVRLIDTNRTSRYSANQLRHRYSENNHTGSDQLPLDLIVTSKPESAVDVETSVNTTDNSSVDIHNITELQDSLQNRSPRNDTANTRPQRQRHPPARLAEYVCE